MSKLRLLLVALFALTFAAPAPAQQYDSGVRGGVPRGDRGGHGGIGIGILPGLILPAIEAGAAAAQQGEQPPPPRYRDHRRYRHRPAAEQTRTDRPNKRARRRMSENGAMIMEPPRGEKRLLPDEILVDFRAGASRRQIAAFARRHRLQLKQSRELTLIHEDVTRFRIIGRRQVRTVLLRLRRDPLVVWAQPHYVFALQDEQSGSSQESAATEGPAPSYVQALLHLNQAHRLADGRGVKVAVIDSLIDGRHPEIAGAIAGRFDALQGASDKPAEHGTGMASAIVGHRKIDGVAPAARILAVRAFAPESGGAKGVGLDIAAGIDWAVRHKAQVINMSFAGPPDPLLARELMAAAKRGVALIAAAGNDGPRGAPDYPAAFPEVIAVSAVDDHSRLYARANRGAYVELAAPGVDVLLAAPRDAYDLSTGTSVACAEVSGVAALVLQEKPRLSAAALRRLLRETAHALAGAKGAGLADAEAAVKREK